MTHFVGLVIAKTEEELKTILAPYSEHLELDPPQWKPITAEKRARMVEHYELPNDSDEEVCPRIEGWFGNKAGRNEAGELGYLDTYNPKSKWDWYTIGGRWSDVTPTPQGIVKDLLPQFLEDGDYTPSVLVTKDEWLASKDWGWWGMSEPTDTPINFAPYNDEHCFVVDFHI